MNKTEIQDIYSLSPMQEGMLFHSLLNSQSNAYFVQMSFNLNIDIDISVFEKSFNTLISRHDIMRTVFIHHKLEKPKQVVLKERHQNIYYEDITQKGEEEKERYIDEYKKGDRNKGFDLSRDILIRISVFKVNEKKYTIIFSNHHIIMDGWCINIVLKELFQIYQSLVMGLTLDLPHVEPYKKYIKWLKEYDKEEGDQYWKEYLEGFNRKTEVPVFRNKISSEDYVQKELTFSVNKNYTLGLMDIAKSNQITLNTLISAIWGILLQIWNGTNDVVFGHVVSGRPPEIEGIEKMLGLFINTIPVRIKAYEKSRFCDILQHIHRQALESDKHSYYPLYNIITHSALKNNLITHILVFQNAYLEQGTENMNNFAGKDIDVGSIEVFDLTSYDFYVAVRPGEELIFKLSYNGFLYNDELVKKIETMLNKIIRGVIENPYVEISKIDIICDEEKEKFLYYLNDTKAEYPRNKTIHDLFYQQVERTPDRIAAVFLDKQINYRELNRKSNQLAYFLKEKGVCKEIIVAMLLHPSIEMIISILAVLKAGGAYLPINPDYPEDRIRLMIEDSGSLHIITNVDKDYDFDGIMEDKERYCIINLTGEDIFTGCQFNLNEEVEAENLAYIIYTSGTTGKPKGVMVEHRNVVSLMVNDGMYFDFNENDVWTMFHSYCFDFSVWEMYGALLYGGKLIIIPSITAKDTREYLKVLKEQKVTVLNQTPTAFYNLIEYELSSNLKHLNLRYVIFGGEALKPILLKDWVKKYPNTKLINMYGITETTVHVTYKEITQDVIDSNVSNIGKPIPTLRTYVMNKNMMLVPSFVSGELYIGGYGVCRGYLNNKDLTRERFVENPYNKGEILYKSGDLVRILANDEMEYLGRIDNQIKIRGHRIEIGEIEALLSRHSKIKEAVVLAKEDEVNNKYLCAYTVADELTTHEIREYLSKVLPDYMIPSYYVNIEKMPLTENGKIDRKALPKPDMNLSCEEKYIPPTNETERKLAQIWNDILGVMKIGINDNFFEMGGHSLKATLLISRVHKELNVEIPLKEVFKKPTIKELSEYIKSAEKSLYTSIVPVEKKEYYPLSSAQKRLYILNQMEGVSTSYNMPIVLIVEGDINKEQLKKTLEKLIKRHESLRTSFCLIDGKLVQKINEEVQFEIQYIQASENNRRDIIGDFVKPFELSKAPLFRIGLIKEDKIHLMLFDMHHIISDGVSMNILIRDFIRLYRGEELESLRIQYKDYSIWQNNMLKSDEMKKQEEYWTDIFIEDIPVLNMPTDYQRPQLQSFEGDMIQFEIEDELTKRLNDLAAKTGTTMYMILLSAYNILLYLYTGQEDIVVGTPTAGRYHADLQEIIGVFVNTFAMRNKPNGKKSFKDFLMEVKDNTLKAFENKDYQFEKLVQRLAIKGDMSRNAVFDTMFVLQNTQESDTDIDIGNVKFKPCNMDRKTAKFDITLMASEQGGKICFEFEYCTKLFKKSTIKRLSEHYINILRAITHDYTICLSQINILSQEEKDMVLYKFNNTVSQYDKEKTIHELFEEQVKKVSTRTAVIYENNRLTYDELNQKANILARLLREKGVGRDGIVGVILERSLEMSVVLLAILKAGGAYLPISPDYPIDRINFMLEDSNSSILITTSRYYMVYKNINLEKVLVDGKIFEGDGSDLPKINSSKDLAYVIYTSGSTGNPKGVMIEHHSLVNRLNWMQKMYPIGEGDIILQKTPYTFDVSVWELFWWSLEGASVCFMKQGDEKDPEAIIQAIERNNITTIHFVPSMLHMFLQSIDGKKDIDRLKSLKKVFASGEALGVQQVKRFNILLYENNKTKLYNLYGPTEATIDVSYFDCSTKREVEIIPIGKPIDNIYLYVLDKYQNPCAVGVSGELYISGTGLARGYLNRSELTSDKFLKNPFVSGERMYATGDLARWLPDGNIEFLGRIDYQVKIRGYRIELGEIETCILKDVEIAEAVVIPKEDIMGSKYLCAYFVAEKEITVQELREHLSQELPEYMIPSYFLQLSEMPLTQNGKIDRKRLPQPDRSIKTEVEYVPPSNEEEEKLVNLWQEVLGIERVGIDDNFFDIGGHSLKAIDIVARAKQDNINISIGDIFKNRTIRLVVRNSHPTNISTETSDIKHRRNMGKNWNVLKYQCHKKVTSYLFRSLPLGIVFAYEDLMPWYYEHFIQVCSQTGDDRHIVFDYGEAFEAHSDVISHIKYGYKDIEETIDIVDYLVEKINSKCYVILCMDEYYLSEKASYMKKHFVHESIIYGYNSSDRVFVGYGFNREQMMEELIFSFEEVSKAYNEGKVNYKTSAGYAEFQAVQLLSVIEEKYNFDVRLFLKELSNYLYSCDKNSKICTLVKIENKTDGMPKDRIKYGLTVYDDLVYSLETMLYGELIIDYRSFHLLSEHKRGIYERLEFVEEKYNMLDTKLVKEYGNIVDDFEILRVKAFEIINSNSFSREDLVKFVTKAINIVKINKHREGELLNRIIQKLKT